MTRMNVAMDLSRLSRRSVLKGWLATGSVLLANTILAPKSHADRLDLSITPTCGEDTGPTRSATEGPFYSENPPEKRDFRSDVDGPPVTLIGYVLSADCQPVPGAIVDLWHANHKGQYDNQGFKLRGYQKTDAQGRYYFETIRPAEYAGRTPHYHVKITLPAGRTLTTQLYFPDEPRNELDHLYDSALLMNVQTVSDGEIGRFDFVLG